MIVLGIICAVFGALLRVPVLLYLGVALIVLGALFASSGHVFY